MKTKLVLAMPVLLLSACTSPLPYHYACDDGQTFGAMMMSDYAVVHVDGSEYELSRIRSASGVLYESENGSVKLHTKGDEALLVVGERSLQACTLSR